MHLGCKFFADVSRKWSQIIRKICDSTSNVVVIIHTKFQLHWMFETEVRWVVTPATALSMNRGTNYPSTNRVKWICLSIFYIWSIVSNSRQSFMKIGWMIPVDAKFYDFIFFNLRGRGVFCQHHHVLVWKLPQQTCTSSKSTIETIEECVKYQS